MSWILDNIQIVIILALALAGWLKSRMEAKAAELQERVEDEIEEVREMYGEAAKSGPPPLVRAVPPPLPELGKQIVKAKEAAQVLQHQNALAERLREIRKAKAAAPAKLAPCTWPRAAPRCHSSPFRLPPSATGSAVPPKSAARLSWRRSSRHPSACGEPRFFRSLLSCHP